jgi:hypothetical protein
MTNAAAVPAALNCKNRRLEDSSSPRIEFMFILSLRDAIIRGSITTAPFYPERVHLM